MDSILNVEPPQTAPRRPAGVFEDPRMSRELKTMRAMIEVYCHAHNHAHNGICPNCEQLLSYATHRLERCRFGPEKPTCAKCPTHCYKKDRLEQVKTVMRFSGPRMLLKHPLLSLCHWLDGFRPVPGGKA